MAFHDPRSLVEEALGLEYFHPNKEGKTPIPAFFQPGEGKLLVVLGENASGKSFFRRITQSLCQKAEVECMGLSMEGRRSIAHKPWLAMVYGDEMHDSTGYNSASVVTTGIRTCRSRTTAHVIFWDEPDLGLSDNGAAGVGVALQEFLQDPPTSTLAAIVVTHSKSLVQPLVTLKPHYLYLGEGDIPLTVEDWLKSPTAPRHPDEILKKGRERYRLIEGVLQSRRKAASV